MAVWRDGSTAGGFARTRYARGLRSWRHRTRWLAAAVFGPFLLVGLAALLIDPRPVAWVAGVVFGAGVGAWVAVRESPPGYVETWQRGAEGEQKTARALHRLEGEGWTVVHDVDAGRGNYDHVVVGPAGVFLLETKYPHGEAYVKDGELWIRKRDLPDRPEPGRGVDGQAVSLAIRLRDQLAERVERGPWVQAVIVLWCAFPDGVAQIGHCLFVHGPRLAQWVSEQPVALDKERVQELAAAVRVLAQRPAVGSGYMNRGSGSVV